MIAALLIAGLPFLVAWLIADEALLEWREREIVESLARIEALPHAMVVRRG